MLMNFALLAALIVLFVLFMAAAIAFLLKLIIKTAPLDVQERLSGRPDAPAWKTALGIVICLCLLLGIAAVLVYAGFDAVRSHMGFWQIFLRFFILFAGYKLFDMFFFDYLLLTKMNVYQKFFPEVAGCRSMEKFGFNLKSQLLKLAAFTAAALIVAAVLVHF